MSDIDSITMFADYRVPQTLVHFGAMIYSGRLHDLLCSNHMFLNGDREEMEIRGCSIHVCPIIQLISKTQIYTLKTNRLIFVVGGIDQGRIKILRL